MATEMETAAVQETATEEGAAETAAVQETATEEGVATEMETAAVQETATEGGAALARERVAADTPPSADFYVVHLSPSSTNVRTSKCDEDDVVCSFHPTLPCRSCRRPHSRPSASVQPKRRRQIRRRPCNFPKRRRTRLLVLRRLLYRFPSQGPTVVPASTRSHTFQNRSCCS